MAWRTPENASPHSKARLGGEGEWEGEGEGSVSLPWQDRAPASEVQERYRHEPKPCGGPIQGRSLGRHGEAWWHAALEWRLPPVLPALRKLRVLGISLLTG